MAKKRDRTLRREEQRRDLKLADAVARLEQLEPGGGAGHPLVVESASQIEPHARAMRCGHCGDALRVLEHAAEQTPHGARRIVTTESRGCGQRRRIYFVIRMAFAN